MFRCKDVAQALSKENIRDMSFWKRCSLVFHILMCPICGKFHKDVVQCQHNEREFSEQDEIGDATLPDETKSIMQEQINKARKGN